MSEQKTFDVQIGLPADSVSPAVANAASKVMQNLFGEQGKPFVYVSVGTVSLSQDDLLPLNEKFQTLRSSLAADEGVSIGKLRLVEL